MQKHIFHTLLLIIALLASPAAMAQDADKKASADEAHIKYIYHTVKKGETVYSIAKLYHAEMDEIFKLNPGSKKSIWLGATLLIPSLAVVEGEADEADTLHIRERLQEFVGLVYQIGSEAPSTLQGIKAAQKKINSVEAKYNTYYQAKQTDIADNDALMELVAEFQQLKQETRDSLEAQHVLLLQTADFAKAEKFIAAQAGVYKQYESQAEKLSLVEATASQLDQLKAKEQTLLADVEAQYQKAKEAADGNPSLAKRMAKVTDNYTALKSSSEKIQGAEYKPFFERIKDYLFSLAAVAILLMFVSMAQAKIKAVKQAREAAKKLEQFRQDDGEHPSI